MTIDGYWICGRGHSFWYLACTILKRLESLTFHLQGRVKSNLSKVKNFPIGYVPHTNYESICHRLIHSDREREPHTKSKTDMVPLELN